MLLVILFVVQNNCGLNWKRSHYGMLSLNSYSSPSCIKIAGIAFIVFLDDLNDIELVVIAYKLGLIECCTVNLSTVLQNMMIGVLKIAVVIDWHFSFELDGLDHLFLLLLLVIL